MKQSDIFADTEGNAWWQRNREKLAPEHDPVLQIIAISDIKPQNVLEIGCADGWRLSAIHKEYGARCTGFDLATTALHEGRMRDKNIYLYYGSTNHLEFHCNPGAYDLVIFGFCLYVLDREDLFSAVAAADTVLKDGGDLIVYDFSVPTPHKVPYHHDLRLSTYKMDYTRLFTANPSYRLIHSITGDDKNCATLVHKDIRAGWPVVGK